MKKLKYIIVLVVICLMGFSLGYFGKNDMSEKMDAAENAETVDAVRDIETETSVDMGKIDNQSESGEEYTLSSNMYTTSYDSELLITYYTLKDEAVMSKSVNLPNKDDVWQLAQQMLECENELRKTLDDGRHIRYEEYKDGYPTGACASFVFDENDNIIFAGFREGAVYDFIEESVISIEEAYKIGVEEIYNKYGKDTIVDGDVYDYEYRIMYKPDLKKLCYQILRVEGHRYGDMEKSINQVEFTITVPMDGTSVIVASSLGF